MNEFFAEIFSGHISWRLVVVAALILMALFMMYRWNKMKGNKYDVLDLVTDEDGRADLWKHLIVFFAGVSAWVIIQKMVTDPKGDITALLTIVLGVFVSKEILGAFADAIKTRPVAPSAPSQDIHITAAPEAPKPIVDIAGRGVEALSPTIGADDVGKAVALVGKTAKKAKR